MAGLVTPAKGLNPNVNQIYPIVNSVFKQMTGLEGIEAVDTASLVAMGSTLTDLGKLDLWLNTLSRRIGLTIDGWRAYESQYRDLHRSQMEWGAYVQKFRYEMPEAVDDLTYDVGKMDGKSVDQWIINNPKVHQKLFDKETPYSFFITIQKKLLREAFLSGGAMETFISGIFGAVQNKINFVMEELGRLCINNFILNVDNAQHYHLVSMYNAFAGTTVPAGKAALKDADFIRWAVGTMQMIADEMKGMSVLYNKEGAQRFTPPDKQRFYILSDFMSRARTVVSYAAFNKEDVTAHPDIVVSYWQARTTLNNPNSLDVKMQIQGSVKDDDGTVTEKTLDNVLGLIFDYDAMGTFREEVDVLTTPVNARARYYNTFWHEAQLWFNDMSENGVVFFLD